ncbi:aspartyl protease family protein [Polaribacter sargassicola]|uniref:aspartyl protease family protein n=1 Tax=Polaribacter sargassicola TaxID=2836891 RepID=UPI001F269A13|nr:aspartyl protease family protein [Polaribacter sp. DS7-9]MCG1035465.1 aspartyl protease family protein [Polaribacter sp. DS7-9]
MKRTFLPFIILLFAISFKVKAQKGYGFLKNDIKKERIKFELINNLIVIDLMVNGNQLSFILDSGAGKTILFNLPGKKIPSLKNVKKVKLRGLGKGSSVDALLSYNNNVSIKNVINKNETIYVVLKDNFDFSSKMGKTIHGIIGYNILRNFIVKINYKTKNIVFYNPKKYSYKECFRCEVFPLQIFRKKPYIEAEVQLDTINNSFKKVKMLIDSGGSDALWLFEDAKKGIKTPNRFFNDILGEGLSGVIYGNRSRVPKIKIGSFNVIKPTVSFLDSISTKNARKFKEREGSIGASILKRFKVWFDYPNQKIMLKKQKSLSKEFNYNMSGLEVVYSGKELVKEEKKMSNGYNNREDNSGFSINVISSFSYKFKPRFKIKSVLKNSAAEKSGLLKDDIIVKINNKPAHDYTLSSITAKFQEKANKKITITVNRNDKILKFEFRLQKKI